VSPFPHPVVQTAEHNDNAISDSFRFPFKGLRAPWPRFELPLGERRPLTLFAASEPAWTECE